MTEQLNHFLSNPWVTLISIISGILGVALAIYFGVKSLPKKKIKVFLSSNELITNEKSEISKLKIMYGEKNIDRLTVTKVIFWNSTFPTINDTDIIKAAPFSVSLCLGTILDISILEGHDTSNKINAELLNYNTAQISFDYLDYKEGGVIQIIHTGKRYTVNISKKLKGGCITTVKRLNIRSTAFSLLVPLTFCYIFLSSRLTLKLFPESWYIQEEIVTLKEGYSLLFDVIFLIILFGTIVFVAFKDSKEFIPKNCKKKK